MLPLCYLQKKDLDMRELKENYCSFRYDFFISVTFSGQKEHQTHQSDLNTKKLTVIKN